MSFSESVKLGFASWDHTISNFRIWIVAALPVLALDIVSVLVVGPDPLRIEWPMNLAWIALSGIASFYLLLPVVTGWHARNLLDAPSEPMPIRLAWTRREWRYFVKLVLAFLAIFLMAIAVGLLTAFGDGRSLGAKIFETVVMTCGLWLTFALSARLWMSFGALLPDPPVPPAEVLPKTVATVLCAAMAPAFVLGAVVLAFDVAWLSRIVGALNGLLMPLAVVAALGALHRRATPPSSATF